MTADLLFHDRFRYRDGAILEMKIWRVPVPVPGSGHALKYSLFYGYPGRRVVGYDNERGKGDHCHRDGQEAPYRFTTVSALVEDFLNDVRRARGET